MSLEPLVKSVYRIGSTARSRLEDFAADRRVRTDGGLQLQLGIVCDGVGSAEWGVQASQTAANTIFDEIERSTSTDIPEVMIKAVQVAHRRLVREIKGEGNTTVALMVIDLNDSRAPDGRLYIASVGDSLIYIVRNNEITRLNIDHNVETEVRRGELAPEAAEGASGSEITRALGVRAQVEVDIGFYKGESETNIIPRDVAEKRGRIGLKLEAGDTIFACSDGLRDLHPDGKPYLEDRLILAHALDLDVEKTANTLVSYGEQRQPTDNVSISLIFIPSSRRKKNYVATRLPVGFIAGIAAAVLIVIIGALIMINNTNSQLSDVLRTGTVVAAAQTQAQEETNIVGSYTPTPTMTLTASLTPTSTFTPTVTPTLTPRPAFIGERGVIGAVYAGLASEAFSLSQREEYTSSDDAVILIQNDSTVTDPAYAYLSFGTGVRFRTVDHTDGGLIEFDLYDGNTGTGLFMWQGQYAQSTVNLLADTNDTTFETNAACWSLDYVAPSQLAITCFANPNNTCRVSETTIPGGQQMVWDLDTSDGQQTTLGAINFDVAARHYERLRTFGGSDAMQACIEPYVNRDRDSLLDPDDACPDEYADEVLGGVGGCLPTATPTYTNTRVPTATRTPTLGMVQLTGTVTNPQTAAALTRQAGDATNFFGTEFFRQTATQAYYNGLTATSVALTQAHYAALTATSEALTQAFRTGQTRTAEALTQAWIQQQTALYWTGQTRTAEALTQAWIQQQTALYWTGQTQTAEALTQAWIQQQTALYWQGQTQIAQQQTDAYWQGQTQTAAAPPPTDPPLPTDPPEPTSGQPSSMDGVQRASDFLMPSIQQLAFGSFRRS